VVKHTAADFTIRRLSVFGLGKLGLPLAVLFAHRGMHTTAIDVDAALVEQLRVSKMPVLEPGLDALMAGAESRLNYTTDARAAADTDASIIVVSTPYEDSRAALSRRGRRIRGCLRVYFLPLQPASIRKEIRQIERR
jgi:UDP-N-acetyl-D-mannosaminuronate dehydrogenase